MNPKTAIKQLKELDKLGKSMRLAAEGWDEDWKTLISILLSARTRDEVTIAVSQKLVDRYPNLEALSKANLSEIENIIKSINFYKNKSKSVLGCAKALFEEHKCKVPNTIDELIKLPGVGRKTANVYIAETGGLGIGIDTHLSYCSQKLGWTKNKDPHKIEEDLKRLFPKQYWNSVNPIAVRFGKTYMGKKKKDELLERIKLIG